MSSQAALPMLSYIHSGVVVLRPENASCSRLRPTLAKLDNYTQSNTYGGTTAWSNARKPVMPHGRWRPGTTL